MAILRTGRQRCLPALILLKLCTNVTGFVIPWKQQAAACGLWNGHIALTNTQLLASENRNDDVMENSAARRSMLLSLSLVPVIFGAASPAQATLVQFPCQDGLMNTYHFMRAGESLLESENILSTNPLFLTNREAALSPKGEQQVHQACHYMEQQGLNPSVVKFSLAANAMDTADLVAMDLQVGRNRLVPEYTYMDQRGVGRWDMLPLQSTQDAVWAMDVTEAGKEGLGGRPPAHEDGTPNETLANQVIRLRQLISLLETSLSGDDILLIFPDGTGPAVLSALIAGIPLDRVHELNFAPGEVRLDVNYDSVWGMLPAMPSAEYQETIARGMDQLQALRSQNSEDILNVREQVYEAELAAERTAKTQLAKKEQEEEKVRLQNEQELARLHDNVSPSTADNEVKVAGFASMGVLGLVAAMAGYSRSDKEEKEDEILAKMEADETMPNSDALSLEMLDDMQELMDKQLIFNTTDIASLNTTDTATTSPELQAMEERIERAPIDIPEFASVEEEREEIAARAMQEYMDQDDGGNAWLGVMSDLMKED